ncbi:VanZ family protein [Streptococcus phocae subsp. salmonis]|uniref:VanZ family protein n=1 Tax=Streptococcus phocae TaxID=119224 RepID=UPI0006892BCE|nr:VanZ family protein [Streptococcus phocae]
MIDLTEFLTPNHKQKKQLLVLWLVSILAVMGLCFTPQPHLFQGIQTPNVLAIGRLRLLLVPLNSLWSLGQLKDLSEVLWILSQNVMNLFLLYPTVFLTHCLSKKWHSAVKSFQLGFLMSLGIEVTQLILDILVDANRVFEIDDLWTNALGALFAYYSYHFLVKTLQN